MLRSALAFAATAEHSDKGTGDAVTVERLVNVLQAVTIIVLRHGGQYADLMKSVDEELEQRRRVRSARDQAQSILRDSMQEVTHAPVG